MKNSIFALILLSGIVQADIVFEFKNPSFSGVGTGAHYLTIENQEHSRKKAIEDAEEKQDYIDKKEEEYAKKFANPYEAAKYGFIDDVIEPRNTRFRIIRGLELLANKKVVNPPKKHSNIPL